MLYIEDHYYQYMNYHIYELTSSQNVGSPHTHRRLELSIILEGNGQYIIGDKTYDVQPGDIYIIDNKTPHKLYVTPGCRMKNMVFHFLPRFFWSGGTDYYNETYLKSFYFQQDDFNHQLTKDMEITQTLTPLLEFCAKEFENHKRDFDLMIKSTFMTIMVYLNRHYFGESDVSLTDKAKGLKAIYKMNAVINYIDQHYTETIRIKDLADLIHLDTCYFTKVFKEINGLTPIHYINHVRIEQASKLLTQEDLTLEQISWKSGFSTYSHFAKVFKEVTTFSPSQYRKFILAKK